MRFLYFFFAISIISACSTRPYVHKSEQFNRSSVDFAKKVTDITNVTICYNTFAATPSEIIKLARDECAHYGKFVSFLKQDYDLCPMTAPMAAYYSCVDDKSFDEGYRVQVVSKGTLMDYNGIKFKY